MAARLCLLRAQEEVRSAPLGALRSPLALAGVWGYGAARAAAMQVEGMPSWPCAGSVPTGHLQAFSPSSSDSPHHPRDWQRQHRGCKQSLPPLAVHLRGAGLLLVGPGSRHAGETPHSSSSLWWHGMGSPWGAAGHPALGTASRAARGASESWCPAGYSPSV